jgi:hypothetical protein
MAIIANESSNPIEAATRRHARLFAVFIGVLIFTALLIALFTWLTEKSGNAVQEAIQADANARIEEAKKEAAEANKTSKQLDADLTVEKGKVAVLQKDASKAKEAQQKVEVTLAQEQTRAAKAEKDLLELQRRIQPRTLSTEQKSRLGLLLSSSVKAKVQVWTLMGDDEARDFAQEIIDVFNASGWPPIQGMNLRMSTRTSPVGMVMGIHDSANVPPSAVAIQQAFFAVGLSMPGIIDSHVPAGEIQIMVGRKQK